MHLKNANTHSQQVTPDEGLDRTPPPEGGQLALRPAADSQNRNLVMYMFKIKSDTSTATYGESDIWLARRSMSLRGRFS